MSENPHKLAVFSRPRSPWQAMDAGMMLARAHYWKLLVLCLTFAIPIITIATVITTLGSVGFLLMWIVWWFKPLYELPILMYLSRVLFNQPTSIRQALKESKPQIIPLLKSYLTLSRLSPIRSMTAPVVFLEQLKGKGLRNRVNILTSERNRAFTLQMAWLHIETIGNIFFIPILIFLLHSDLEREQVWRQLFHASAENGIVDAFLLNVMPTLFAALVAPFFVSSGFLLYINRRMQLEAWDIEHQFHDLESRHNQSSSSTFLASCLAPITLVGIVCVITVLSINPFKPAIADTSKTLAPMETIRESVSTIYESENFGSSKTVNSLRFKKSKKQDGKAEQDNKIESKVDSLITAFFHLLSFLRALIYLIAGMCVALVIWALLKFMPDSWQFSRQKPELELLDVDHHPLTRSLPTDIETSAQAALQQGNHREAISLLYRGALRTVMRRHAFSIPKSATEKECQYWVAQCEVEEQTSHFKHVVSEWLSVAYANHRPTEKQTSDLIEFWESNFKFDKVPQGSQ